MSETFARLTVRHREERSDADGFPPDQVRGPLAMTVLGSKQRRRE